MCEIIKKPDFVHVHVHTSASSLDGCARGDLLVKRAKEFGHKALAITDHGSPAGIYSFAKDCKKSGIKPILGLEFYIAQDLESRVPNKNRSVDDRDYHQSVFIKDKTGYKNFNYLTYVSFTDGYYYKPRIDFDLLFNRKRGLMVTSSCMASRINQLITGGREKDAEQLFKQFRDNFGDDFYGEIQLNELNPDFGTFNIDQRANNKVIIDLCQKYDVPILIGGDVHYLDKGDAELQDALINSKRQAKEGEEGFQIHARHLYYHDVSDYYDFDKRFNYNYGTEFLEKCFENSVKFAEKVDFEFETGKNHVPKINTGKMSEKEYLEKITWEGIKNRIEKFREFGHEVPNHIIDTYETQIPYELNVINDLGLDGYLLVVYDIIKWERENDIFVGAGRGSCCGSLVAYAIGITDLCPIEYKLLFERFINPSRRVIADIDWDQDSTGRDKVVEYLIETYGRECVCNVATYGTYSPKSALKDMARGLRKTPEDDAILNKKICKIPELAEEGVNKWKPKTGELIQFFEDYYKSTSNIDIRGWIDRNRDTIRLSDKLQGQMKSIGTHAGGIVVTPGPIYNYIPVMKNDKKLVTAFREADGSSKDLGELGVLKLDVLGLKTLDVFKDCIKAIKEDKGIDLSEKIRYLLTDDDNLIRMFASGNNYGIFQMDRSAMFTSQFRNDGAPVDSFEDIVAINAMNRPGPLEKFLPKYGYWKAIDQGKIKLTTEELAEVDKERYPFEFMRKSLNSTYACMLYQEQFMQMVCDASDFTFGEADSFRRGIAWRKDHPKYYTVAGYYEKLEKGMIEKGYSTEDTNKFVEYCRSFMGYSFNKCIAGTESLYRTGTSKERFQPTIEEMYNIKNDIEYARSTGHLDLRKKYNRFGYGCGFSLNDDRVLVKNDIVDIRYEGIKPIYRMTLTSGKTIDTTDNHKFPTNNGTKELKDIIVGKDKIFVNNGYKHVNRSHKFDTGISNLPVKGQLGFQKVDTGFTQLQAKSKILLAANPHCQLCPSSKRLEVHHIDNDHGNQSDDNLAVLCSSCHKKAHYKMGRTKMGEKGLGTLLEDVVSIEYLKDDKVYDVEMATPYHNFVTANDIVTCNSHSVAYSYISWQTLYFKYYYPAYFYAAMLNSEDKEDKIQEIIQDAKKNSIDILPLSISKSQFLNRAETDSSVRLGYKLIRGMGDAVQEELVQFEMHKCKTIDEVLQKPFKKINKTALDNLIKLGCFDEFGVEREMIEKLKSLYKEPKIEKWFTRKRSPGEEKTMPECLSEAFEPSMVMGLVPTAMEDPEPHTRLVSLLMPYLKLENKEDPEKKKHRIQKETIDKEVELLGFSISADDSFDDFARAMKAGGFNAISDYDPDEGCYFKVTKIVELKTKSGKPYWQYTLNDGKKEFKAKVWRNMFKNVNEGDCCVGVLSLDPNFGWTLFKCEFVK